MKKQPLFPLVIAICVVIVFLLGFFLGRNTVTTGTKLTAVSPSLIPTTASTAVTSPPVSVGNKLDINTASQKDFTALPGIGESIAAKIVEYRDSHGSFSDIAELMEVPGIGQKRYEAIETLICIGDTP